MSESTPPIKDQGSDAGLPADLRAAIEHFAREPRVLVASDFDGVLAPLVLDPMSSRPQPGTVEALRALAELPEVDVAVVSGRDLATLRKLTGLSESDAIVLVGSHGAESSEPLTDGSSTPSSGLGEAEQAALEGATHALEAVVERFGDARVEHKPAGVVLHTRGMDDDEAARASAAALAVPEDVPGVRAMRGKSVVELSVLDVTKGSALGALAQKLGTSATAYFGDDVTDETVFEALDATGGHVTVKVGEGDTAAAYRVDSCEAMPTLLKALLEARTTR